MQTIQTTIELFHLLFLRQLGGRLDKKLYALKGECNLRFFFKSIRYSEDIDFDVTVISKLKLQNKITKILQSVDFRRILQSKKIEIIQSNPVKQTDTTQRWKILLRIPGSTLAIPTKIEFSRRKIDNNIIYSAVDNDVIRKHNLYPILCNHYEINAAFQQKVIALIHRTETQARDVFDLKWLFEQGACFNMEHFSQEEIKIAIKNINGITYADFKGQVLAYLMEEYMQLYGSPEMWRKMCDEVINVLQEVKG